VRFAGQEAFSKTVFTQKKHSLSEARLFSLISDVRFIAEQKADYISGAK
jgi:hypothetical protein